MNSFMIKIGHGDGEDFSLPRSIRRDGLNEKRSPFIKSCCDWDAFNMTFSIFAFAPDGRAP